MARIFSWQNFSGALRMSNFVQYLIFAGRLGAATRGIEDEGLVQDLEVLRVDLSRLDSSFSEGARWLALQNGYRFPHSRAVPCVPSTVTPFDLMQVLPHLPQHVALPNFLTFFLAKTAIRSRLPRPPLRRCLLHLSDCLLSCGLSYRQVLELKRLVDASGETHFATEKVMRSSTIEKEVERGINASLAKRPKNGTISLGCEKCHVAFWWSCH